MRPRTGDLLLTNGIRGPRSKHIQLQFFVATKTGHREGRKEEIRGNSVDLEEQEKNRMWGSIHSRVGERQGLEKKGHLAAGDEPPVILDVVLGHLLEGVHLGRHDLRLPQESLSVGKVCGSVT
jgi:hypothetical protein